MYQNAALLAVFLLIYNAVAGRIERSFISGPIVFTVAGFILGQDGLGVLRINTSGERLRLPAELPPTGWSKRCGVSFSLEVRKKAMPSALPPAILFSLLDRR
jgi:hypothetical protein